METLRAKVAAFIEGRELPSEADGAHRGESQALEQASLSGALRKGGSTEEGIPPSVPMSAALPHGYGGGAVDAADGISLKLTPTGGAERSADDTLSAPVMQFGLSPVSTASSLPYNGTVADATRPGGLDGAPPASPMPSGTNVSTGHSRTSTAGSKPGTIHAL
eukprot:COSAG02_NODE_3021_length_7531_cov_1.977667_2_plen_163_part_00